MKYFCTLSGTVIFFIYSVPYCHTRRILIQNRQTTPDDVCVLQLIKRCFGSYSIPYCRTHWILMQNGQTVPNGVRLYSEWHSVVLAHTAYHTVGLVGFWCRTDKPYPTVYVCTPSGTVSSLCAKYNSQRFNHQALQPPASPMILTLNNALNNLF